MRFAILAALAVAVPGCYPSDTSIEPSPQQQQGRGQPPLTSPGNSSACGRDTSYLDAIHQSRQFGPFEPSHPLAGYKQDYWRFSNPPAAIINRAIADGFAVDYQHGNYIVTRTCR